MENTEENSFNNDGHEENSLLNGNNKRVKSRNELFKRKQKRTIENLKGFGRKGIFGRGTELDADEGNYFMRISEAIKEEFDTTEERRMYCIQFITNKLI